MFSSSAYATSALNASADGRPGYSHSHSGSGFAVAGMSSQGMGSPSLRNSTVGGSSLGMSSSLGDSLSRSQYQSGYLMSAQPNSMLPMGSQRHEDVPIVQTKAKLNQSLVGRSASEFGVESMFENSNRRSQRQPLADEDAPPTASVNDIVNEVYNPDSSTSRRRGTLESSTRSLFRSSYPSTPKSAPSTPAQPLYVIVFGYPPDRYSVTAEYFRALGETTEPEPSPSLANAFRIGFLRPAEALRAVRKNGEVLAGEWMVGAKWADPAQAEALLGPVLRGALPQSPELAPVPDPQSTNGGPSSSPPGLNASTGALFQPRAGGKGPSGLDYGTPIRLAPSTAAFRKGPPPPAGAAPAQAQARVVSPSKGVLEQVSDLIFGW